MLLDVTACLFAEFAFVADQIQNIILHLKSQPDMGAELTERLQLLLIGSGDPSARQQ
ncbi:hypothetical protein D3C75_1249010 [compost metagenome]